MISDTDLSKIGKLVRKEIEPIKTDTKKIRLDFQKEFTPIKTDLKTLKSDVQYVKKTADLII